MCHILVIEDNIDNTKKLVTALAALALGKVSVVFIGEPPSAASGLSSVTTTRVFAEALVAVDKHRSCDVLIVDLNLEAGGVSFQNDAYDEGQLRLASDPRLATALAAAEKLDESRMGAVYPALLLTYQFIQNNPLAYIVIASQQYPIGVAFCRALGIEPFATADAGLSATIVAQAVAAWRKSRALVGWRDRTVAVRTEVDTVRQQGLNFPDRLPGDHNFDPARAAEIFSWMKLDSYAAINIMLKAVKMWPTPRLIWHERFKRYFDVAQPGATVSTLLMSLLEIHSYSDPSLGLENLVKTSLTVSGGATCTMEIIRSTSVDAEQIGLLETALEAGDPGLRFFKKSLWFGDRRLTPGDEAGLVHALIVLAGGISPSLTVQLTPSKVVLTESGRATSKVTHHALDDSTTHHDFGRVLQELAEAGILLYRAGAVAMARGNGAPHDLVKSLELATLTGVDFPCHFADQTTSHFTMSLRIED